MRRAWSRLSAAYVGVMRSRWGYDVFGRALPSTFFLLAFVYGLGDIRALLPHLPDLTPAGLLALVGDASWRVVAVSQVVFFAIRKRPVGPPPSLLGAGVALVASFFGTVGIFFNTLGLRPPPPQNPDPWLAALAFGTSSLGLLLLAFSFVYLGRHIGVFPEARGLVRRGPYRVLRHPIYTAYLLGAAGSLPLHFHPATAVPFAVYYALVAWRAALEERALERVFGAEYGAYRDATWGVGPPRIAPRRA